MEAPMTANTTGGTTPQREAEEVVAFELEISPLRVRAALEANIDKVERSYQNEIRLMWAAVRREQKLQAYQRAVKNALRVIAQCKHCCHTFNHMEEIRKHLEAIQ